LCEGHMEALQYYLLDQGASQVGAFDGVYSCLSVMAAREPTFPFPTTHRRVAEAPRASSTSSRRCAWC
jgi:hypothetical protein